MHVPHVVYGGLYNLPISFNIKPSSYLILDVGGPFVFVLLFFLVNE